MSLGQQVHRGEIYLIDLSDNIGSEQGGIRPAIIVQNEIGNQHSPTTIICPITSKEKDLSATHVPITPHEAGVKMNSTVLCEQIRVIDKTRILKRLGEVKDLGKIEDINRKIVISLQLAGGKRSVSAAN